MENMRKQILWIGALSWLKKDLSYFPNASYPGIVSGSAFQQSIIEGMEEQGIDVQILTDCDMNSGKRLEWSHNERIKDVRVAGKKGRLSRIISKTINLIKEIKNSKILKEKEAIIAYEMHLPYLLALRKIKKINKNMSTILICPDLSIYMDVASRKKTFKRVLKKIENYIMKKLLKYVDGVVVFTEQMYEYFKGRNIPYVVVEGVCRNKFSLEEKEKKSFILHAGSLHHNTGIEELIYAFKKIDEKDIDLVFCGKGAMDKYILEKAKTDRRIKHLGFISPQLLFEYEKEALMLINVRNPIEEYTKYSFPSKTFEFMLSGTIILSTDLEGIPDEYKEYMVIIKDNNVDTITDGINKIIRMKPKERFEIGKKARNFVLENKNYIVQSSKIINLINVLSERK